MREKQFEEQVKRWLESKGIYRIGTPFDQMPIKPVGYWLKRWGGSKYIPKGVPDMQITVGIFNIDVELKSETGHLDPLQVQKLQQIKESGGYCMVLRPKTFDRFKEWIEAAIKRDYQLKCTGEVWGCYIGHDEFCDPEKVWKPCE